MTSTPDVSTVGNSPKNRALSNGTNVNISADALEGIDTPSITDAQASTNAPGSTGVTTSAGASTNTDALGNIDFKTVPTTTSSTLIARDCSDIKDQGFTENYGIYRIQPSNDSESFKVVCDLETNGEQWIVFQRRFDGSVDFNRAWVDYKNGFGNLNGEHWLGLEKLHMLTTNGDWKLRVDLEDFDNVKGDAEYSSFAIGDESTNYTLSIGECDLPCIVPDDLDYHRNMAFTTYDQDHDINVNENCAVRLQGGWWFTDNFCYQVNLNGLYIDPPVYGDDGIRWRSWNHRNLKKSEMKMTRIWWVPIIKFMFSVYKIVTTSIIKGHNWVFFF